MSQTEAVKADVPDTNPPAVQVPAANGFDEVPIGAGPKFNFSQFPEEGHVAKAPPKRKKAGKVESKAQSSAETKPESKPQSKTEPKQMDPKKGNPLDEIPIGGNKFDEKPIGKGNFMVDQFPPEGQQVQTTEYTMLQKLKSKANKLRMEGMQKLISLLEMENEHPDYADITMASLLKETTPLNMERALSCMKAWMSRAKQWGEDEARLCIEYGYINGKGASKKLSVEVVDSMYSEKPSLIEMTLLLGLKHKTPKMIAGFIAMINELLAIYGIKRMKYLKPYLPEVVHVLNTEKLLAVKNEGIELIKSSFKWLGKEVVMPMLDALKDNLKKELESFWDTYDKTAVMTAPKDIPEEKGKQTKKIDAYELSEAVDVFKRFNEKWAEGVLSAEKWNEKTKMMEEFVKGANTPKIANTEYRHITELIKRLINDSNFNVVLWSMKMLGVLSKGLRRQFIQTIRSMFGTVIGKFRDKKNQMIDETFNTLQDFLHAISLEDVIEDLKEGLQDKAPNMKAHLITWIAKVVEAKAEDKGDIPNKTKDALRDLFPIFQRLLADSTADVRDSMAKGVGKMKLLIGDQFFLPIEKNLNKNIASKMQVDPKDVKRKSETTAREPDKKKEEPKKEEIKKESYDSPSFEESVALLLTEGFPEEEVKHITDGGAKERHNILTLMKENGYSSLNCVLRVLKRTMKDWREANLNMNKDFCLFLEEHAAAINKEESYVILPFIVERFADSKFTEPLLLILRSVCSRVPPRFIATQIVAYTRSTEAKRPKLYSDSCILLARIMEMVSATHMPLKHLMEFAEETFNIMIAKKGAMELIRTTYSYMEDALRSMLDEAVYKEMDFKDLKGLSEEEKRPRVVFEGEAAMECKAKPVSKGVKMDISGDIVRLLPKMNDKDNWQNRKEAAETLIRILNDNNLRVILGPIHDLIATLKVRINDPNKGLIKTFLCLTGLIFTSMSERDLKAHAKPFITSLIEGLSDKLEVNRKETHTALHKLGQALGGEALLTQMATHLEGEKESRFQILVFMLCHEEWLLKADVRDYPKGLVGCLCDKNKDIRAQGERLFEAIYDRIGIEVFRTSAKDTKPAFIKDLNALFDRFEKKIPSNTLIASRISSRKNSPQNKERRSSAQPPTPSKQKQSLPKNTSFDPETELRKTLVINGQFFAPLKILCSERIERQQCEETWIWRAEQIKETQEQDLLSHIRLLFRCDLSRKMVALDPRRPREASAKMSQLCGDPAYHPHIKELSDLLLKWVLLRLYGGNHHMLPLIELVKDVLCVLEKKAVLLLDHELELVLCIVREYILSAYIVNVQLSGSVFVIIKCLVALTSGEKVIRKIFKMYPMEFVSIPPQNKMEFLIFFRSGLNGIIKEKLMNYVGSEDILEEASKLQQLKNDKAFVQQLSKKFHEKVLASFGFKAEGNPRNNQQSSHSVSSMRAAEPMEAMRPIESYRSAELMKTEGTKSLQPQGSKKGTTALSPNIPRPDLTRTTQQPIMARTSQAFNHPVSMQMLVSQMSQIDKHSVSNDKGLYSKERPPFDLSFYPAPLPSSTLAKYLRQLFPPTDDSVIVFFTQIFAGSGEKITTELNTHAKLIFGSILRSVQEMLKNRKQFLPQKVLAQINLLQNCIRCKAVTKHVDQLLYYCASFALSQLVYEDQNKTSLQQDLRIRNIDFKIDQFVKAINGVMLRILENTDPIQVTLILYELLMTHLSSPYPTSKTTNLISKCMSRVSPHFPPTAQPKHIQQFILRSNEYLSVSRTQRSLEQFKIANPEKPKPQESILQMIKSVISEVGKQCGPEIWEHYKKAMQMTKFKDQHIASYITFLNIRYPDQPTTANELKNIVELLSKSKSFEAGMSRLRSYCNTHPDFDVGEYFASHNYDEKFIDIVMREIAGGKKTPRKDRDDRSEGSKRGSVQGVELQKKMEKLKQKFQELQPENNENKVLKEDRPLAPDERTQLIQRRINQMKNNMSSAVQSRARND